MNNFTIKCKICKKDIPIEDEEWLSIEDYDRRVIEEENKLDEMEELRIVYVAMTRARERLFVSYADTRMRNGETVRNPLSRFVREIDPAYLDMPASSRRTFGSQPYGVTGRTFGSPGPAGDTVRHVSHTAFGSPSTSPSAHRPGPSFPASSALDFVPDPAEQITVGMRVLHKTFGEGEVLEIEGTLPNIKATVRFDHAGMKQLLLKFARLKIVHP